MSSPAASLLPAIPWEPGRPGTFPGQRSVLKLGRAGVEMIFCWCPPTPPGKPFLMGSPPDEAQRGDSETQKEVTIPHGFWLAQHPVNQQQWEAVMGTNPSRKARGDLYPVDSVSWNMARDFCRRVAESGPAIALRLPTEAEWEYACRAGTTTPFGIGVGDCLNAQMANFDGNYPCGSGPNTFQWLYREKTLLQGSFPPNAWGLHDMHGQLWEWCEDLLSAGGRDRVLRGGGWIPYGGFARSAIRHGYAPGVDDVNIGFRPCPSSTRDQPEAGGRRAAAERGGE